jgi:autotransporter-associated beta strand protein
VDAEIFMSNDGGTSVLNITGGTVSVRGHVLDGGSGHSTVTLDGSTIGMQNHNIGGATSLFQPPPHDVGPPIDVLDFRSGTLKNVKQINSGAGLTKTTAGTLPLEGTNTFTGPTTVSAGTLIFKTSYTTGSALQIANGAIAQLARNVATPNSVVLKTGSINTNTSGKLDVTDTKLIVTAQTLSSVQAKVLTGRNGGNWDGSGGIVTSLTAASAVSGLTTLAVATAGSVNKTSFGGESVSVGDVLVMYTYVGDANLSGRIDGNDFFRIDHGYNTHASGWVNGDFNYNGTIDADDYWLIDRNYSRQDATLGGASV